MPYTYKKQGNKYCVYKKDGGKQVGCTTGTKAALKRYLSALHMAETSESLQQTLIETEMILEDLRAWFGKGGKGGVGGGGWDRYNSKGDRVGKCGDADEGDAYAACLSKEKARKLGKAGRAAFVKRKRAAQRKGGDAVKGGEQSKGQKPIKVKTGINEIGEASARPYKYKVDFEETDPEFSEIQYKFKTDSNLEYQIAIAQVKPLRNSKNVRLVVAFRTTQGTYNTDTNRNEQFRIMATVVAATKEYLSKTPNVTEISFTPSKADMGDMRRANLYKAYIAKQIPGAKINIFSDGRYVVTLPKVKKENLDPKTFKDTGKSSPYGSGYQAIREYTPSNPGNIDKAIREIEALGIRNPINPKEIVIDNSVIIEVSNWDKRLWFSSLYSIERGQGNATRIMQKIVDIADKYKVTIALDPHPFGTGTGRLSRSQLVKFYKKFGFEFEDGQEDFGDMERIAERINLFVERNIPTNPEKWSYYKSQAKKKFDVYPSAYANAWAAKMYKKAGGGWRKGK